MPLMFEVTVEKQNVGETSEVMKRKRGRPRKNSAYASSKSIEPLRTILPDEVNIITKSLFSIFLI